MLLKKTNKYFFTLIFLFRIGFSQDYLPSTKIALDKIRSNREFFPDLIAASGSRLVFIDKKNHTLGSYYDDTLRVVGGYGSFNQSFIDPVDIVIDKLDIIILDEAAGRLSTFDFNMNFIRGYTLALDHLVYPSVFEVDSRKNIYFYSPEDGVLFQSNHATQSINKFIDYSSTPVPQNCLSDIYINNNDHLGILFGCSNELQVYNRSGRLQRKYAIDLKNPQKLIFINQGWSVINSKGQVHFINGPLFDLSIEKEPVLDSYFDSENLFILTKTNIYIFDSNIFQ